MNGMTDHIDVSHNTLPAQEKVFWLTKNFLRITYKKRRRKMEKKTQQNGL